MKIILGVTGSVAAYKAAELARRLMDQGLSVHVAMTANAEKFVTPLTFEALTGVPVLRAGFPRPGDDPMPHITFAKDVQLIVVAPATANIIGKLANGVADDTLSTLLIAHDLPVLIAPAMNVNMYNHPAVQANIETLKRRGVRFIGPARGELACGDVGEGKMEEVDTIVAALAGELNLRRDLAGKKIIVTAGGAREPIDAVRFIGNRSSGKMGAAIAQAALRRGAEVTLIAGVLEVAPPEGASVVRAETAADMLQAVDACFGEADALIMAAAVGDYRALGVANIKLKKKDRWDVSLVRNPDILEIMSAKRTRQVVVGFAAETGDAEAAGRGKLLRKNLDMIVINDVSRSDIGFGADENEVTIITRGGETVKTPRMPKSGIARIILDKTRTLLDSRKGRPRAGTTGA